MQSNHLLDWDGFAAGLFDVKQPCSKSSLRGNYNCCSCFGSGSNVLLTEVSLICCATPFISMRVDLNSNQPICKNICELNMNLLIVCYANKRILN